MEAVGIVFVLLVLSVSLVCKGFRYYCASGGSRSYENQMQFGKHKVNEAHMRNHVACPES